MLHINISYKKLLSATCSGVFIFAFVCITVSCSSKESDDNMTNTTPITPTPTTPTNPPLFQLDTSLTNPTQSYTDNQLLDSLQKSSIAYFWEYAHPTSKLARERYHVDDPNNDKDIVTIGGTGFGILSILVAIDRGFVGRAEGVQRLKQMMSFLSTADRFHGAWSHWMNGVTGKVIPFGQKDNGGDLVETSFLCTGLICVREYFKNGTAEEKSLATQCDDLWKGVEFSWYTKGEDALYWHWSPNYAWEMNFKLEGYNECLIAYILGASSPTFGITAKPYDTAWVRKGAIKSSAKVYNIPVVFNYNGAENSVGPLFFSHYSFLGLDPMGLSDAYANYEDLTKNHAKIYVQYSINNPRQWKGYNANCWGLTAGYTRKDDGTMDYSAHQITTDRGVINPTAALSSFPYTPVESMQFLRFVYGTWKKGLVGVAGPYDAFSPHYMWVVPRYLAIDQGTIAPMVENHRTQLLWRLFMNAPEVQAGLKKLKFHSTRYNF